MDLVTKVTDGRGFSTTYGYSQKGDLTTLTKPNSKATDFGYDSYGRLTQWRQYLKVGDPSMYSIWDHQRQFAYDVLGRVTTKTDWYNQGAWDTSRWDPYGDPPHVTTSRVTGYAYDQSSLLTTITYPGPVTESLYYDPLGRRTRATATGIDLQYGYDAASNLTSVAYNYDSGTVTKAVSYAHDREMRRTTMTDGEGTVVAYSYDTDGRLSTVTEGGSARGAYSYDLAGRRTRLTLGSNTYTDYGYDDAGRLTSVANRKSDDSDISRFTYTLDSAGIRRTMAISGDAYTLATVVYDYDNAYQVTKETRTGGNAFTETYWYDNSGNRTKSLLGSTTTNYYYDYIDRLTQAGTTAYSWDVWGNLTKVGANDAYYWDSADRLTKYDGYGSANDTTYTYAPGSWERVKRTRAGASTYSLWDGDNLESEYLTDGTRSQLFVMAGLDEQLSTTTTGGTYYYLHDGLGSVRNLINTAEAVTNTYDTRAYGQDQGTQTTGATNPFRYTGAYDDAWESASGPVYYLRNRYYLPSVGLFASRDAMWADGARGWGYVWNCPTSYVDRFGHAPNQAGTTDPETIKKEIEDLECKGLPPEDILKALAEKHIDNNNRYFYTDKYGWVDVRHFMTAAGMGNGWGSVVTKALGFGLECEQWANEWGDDYRSGFSPEDLPSNSAGADFGDDNMGTGASLSEEFSEWLKGNGARPQDDPNAGKGNLPLTDPAVRGGAGGGSLSDKSTDRSNCSSAPAEPVEAEPEKPTGPEGSSSL